MNSSDLYAVLGVLPGAEDIVITAAYRALAQRYHPDRWLGNPTEAHQRMCEINEAYRVLGDKVLRSEYDKNRPPNGNEEYRSQERQDFDEAFNEALHEVEERWEVALSIFPDLGPMRDGLSKISTTLAFTFVTTLLESKSYAKRGEIAGRLERTFLNRYFGTDERIVEFAKNLILAGNKEAARSLNRLVDVMGSSVDPDLLIRRVDSDYGIREAQEKTAGSRRQREQMHFLADTVRRMGYFDEACQLAKLFGYEVREVGGGFFADTQITVASETGSRMKFANAPAFVSWVQQQLCPVV